MRGCVVPLFLLSSLAACRGEGTAGRAKAEAGEEVLLGRVEILEPADGDTVGPDVRIVLRTEGVVLEPAQGERVPGRGHHHIFVDTEVTPASEPIPRQVEGIVHLGTGASQFTLRGLTPGEHRLIAVLAYGDHVPMERVVTDTVTVRVELTRLCKAPHRPGFVDTPSLERKESTMPKTHPP
jgi:hypothetical protein